MSKNKESLTKEDEKEEKKDETKRLNIFGEKKKKKSNIRDYIFNDLKQPTDWWKDNLSAEEEKKLFKKYRKTWDKVAFDKIVVTNLRFVVYMAKRFFSGLKTQYNCRDIYLDDLIQAWNIWLIKAAKKYVPGRKRRFLVYAQYVIKSSMMYYIMYENRFFWTGPEWGVPKIKVRQMNKYVESFIHENQREPQDEELEQFYEDNGSLWDYSTKVQYYKNVIDGILSLDMSVDELSQENNINEISWLWNFIGSDDRETCMRDLLIDKELENLQSKEMDSLKYDLNILMHRLETRKREILEMSYGLNWHKKLDLDEIADYFMVTKNAISRQKQKAMETLKEDETVQMFLKKYLW